MVLVLVLEGYLTPNRHHGSMSFTKLRTSTDAVFPNSSCGKEGVVLLVLFGSGRGGLEG
jgi:hypothetical protein